MGGQPDSMISTVCQSESRILITLDTDFCNILNYPPETYPGIIVIRTLDQSKPSVLGFMERILTTIKTEEIEKRLWVVQKGGIRIR
jgi:predicted nuclease of predicted toxin-antitoxin system